MKSAQDMTGELRERLKRALGPVPVDGLLFSGGLDTSILAILKPPAAAITVSLESFGRDLFYARLVSGNLKLKHHCRKVTIDEAIDSISDVIRILGNFDPAIPNDLVVYFGLKLAQEKGIKEIMTGDGSDELFAGYDFMRKIRDLDSYLKRITQSMSFSSNRLGDFFGIKIRQPFIDEEFVDFALKVPVELKLREENGNLWGKWILRKAFEELLSAKVAWQDKRPLESGSGMRELRKIISSRISDEEFAAARRRHPIKFMNKEHLYYYRIYKKEIGNIPQPESGQKACPGCGTGMDLDSFHCGLCGNVLDWRI
jgi:asparagine synthase (glutamine-hydrolysing)